MNPFFISLSPEELIAAVVELCATKDHVMYFRRLSHLVNSLRAEEQQRRHEIVRLSLGLLPDRSEHREMVERIAVAMEFVETKRSSHLMPFALPFTLLFSSVPEDFSFPSRVALSTAAASAIWLSLPTPPGVEIVLDSNLCLGEQHNRTVGINSFVWKFLSTCGQVGMDTPIQELPWNVAGPTEEPFALELSRKRGKGGFHRVAVQAMLLGQARVSMAHGNSPQGMMMLGTGHLGLNVFSDLVTQRIVSVLSGGLFTLMCPKGLAIRVAHLGCSVLPPFAGLINAVVCERIKPHLRHSYGAT